MESNEAAALEYIRELLRAREARQTAAAALDQAVRDRWQAEATK
jgi:uncharacterized protein (DUF2267 family)